MSSKEFMVRKIDSFGGHYAFLSNFHPSEVKFKGDVYPTVEHAYQAAKTMNPAEREAIRKQATPGKAKKMGQRVKIRKDWESVKLEVMKALVKRKFRDPELWALLLETGSATLIEGNYWGDTYWGVCKGIGDNNLGKILMELRDELAMRYGI